MRPRNGVARFLPGGARAMLLGILLAATLLRLWHIGFGLPSLNDPDEPLFVMKALDMLRAKTFDPGWFGHPATTLFYALALIFALVGMVGSALGSWTTATGFAAAVFAEPGLLVLPGRVLMLLCGLACVYLTYRIGKRVAGPRVGLVAAALLAVNPLHVELSQIIRTDMPATALMLLSTLYAVAVAQHGRRRDIVLAGVAAGLACATKWPAAIAVGNVECALLWLALRDRRRLLDLPIAPVVAVVTLVAVSPFLLIDHAIVARDLMGEARPYHLGSTGGGFFSNLGYYLGGALRDSFGTIGMLLAALGCIASVLPRYRLLAVAAFPASIVFIVSISLQSLIWERWIVPALPFVALAVAVGVDWIALRLPPLWQRRGLVAMTTALCLAMLSWTVARTRERSNDTRQIASAWLQANVDPHSSVLIEHAAFDLIGRPGRLLFPMGQSGCVDIRAMMAKKPSYAKVEKTRSGAIVDLGNVEPSLLPTCRTDYAIFTHYARYEDEQEHFAPQLQAYRRLAHGGTVRLIVDPIPGVRGGPTVFVVQLAR